MIMFRENQNIIYQPVRENNFKNENCTGPNKGIKLSVRVQI